MTRNLQPDMKLADLYSLVNSRFASLQIIEDPRGLFEPLDYSIKNGGKRIRPVLTLLSAHLFGGDLAKAFNPAIGLELFHNFTLIHDDIMDNAPLRRGQPSVFTKWDSNTAILSGDALFALAGKYMTQVDDLHLRRIMDLYHKTVLEVCKGQQYDMEFEKRTSVTLGEYLEMIRLKTAVLPAACLQVGAIVANASEKNLKLVYDFGELIGLAFQIKDDWLDLFGNEEKFGKKTGGDIIANKKTWLYLKALEVADKASFNALANSYSSKAFNEREKIASVKNIFKNLSIDKLALLEIDKFYERAIEKLNQIEAPEDKKSLLYELAEGLVERET
ncbi:MAG TPA: polyprenyl synthetase family protein [Bacteroidales bacterium]|nr:polyprenyl synthetase family protein [Bacteroidales bacterium]